MYYKNKVISIILIILLLFNFTNIKSLAIGGNGSSDKTGKITENKEGIPVFRFTVNSTFKSAKYKYKTIGWKMKFTPNDHSDSAEGYTPFSFNNNLEKETVDIKLEDIFDRTGLPEEDKLKGGYIEVDAMQIILIDGVPMAYDKKPVNANSISGWKNNTQILIDNNNDTSLGNRRVQIFTDDESGIMNGLPNGLKWGNNTQKDLPTYYNKTDRYPPLLNFGGVMVELDCEPTTTVSDHTIDMTKGEGSAQVKIHTVVNLNSFIKNTPAGKYLSNPRNIRWITITLEDKTKGKQKKTITRFNSLKASADFTFNYTADEVEDGDADMDDTVTKDYKCEVEVRYYNYYGGKTRGSTSVELVKKAPIPQGYPIAILSVPEEVLVGEEIIADGSASIAPERSYIANYKWQVEAKDLPNEEGKKTIKLKYNEPQTVTIALTIVDDKGRTDKSIKDVIVKKKETVKPPSNWCPDVSLTGPTIVMMGDSLTLNIKAEDKEDGMLKPTLSKPSCLILNSSVQNGKNRAKFTKEGTYTVTAKATDSGGKSDTDSIEIEVCPPKPLAMITEKGDYKIGQTVVLDSSKSQPVSRTYPIDWKLTKWEIKPLENLSNSDIFYKKLNDREIAFTSKKTGKVEISLTVTNVLGYSNTRTIERTIIGDTPPKADFSLVEKVYRDKDNDKKATVKAFDKSTSPDGDTITKRTWFYAFDSNNDGVFTDETWYYNNGTSWMDTKTTYDNLFTFADTVETGNLTDVTVETEHVGKYKFALKVYEEHDNRLLEFIDSSYILSDDTKDKPVKECISEVDNIAPVTSVKVDISKDETYDIVVATDYSGYDYTQLKNQLNILKANAFANNKILKIHYITDQKKIGKYHEVKNMYTYARMIDLKYYFESGEYEWGDRDSSRDREVAYNHDLQEKMLQYETTESFTPPTIPFTKGDEVDWDTTTFHQERDTDHSQYDKTGTEFQFFNPDNKIATLYKYKVVTDGDRQLLDKDFELVNLEIWRNIVIGNITVDVGNTWVNTGYYKPIDLYHDMYGIEFNQIEDINYQNDSKKIFLCFIEGTKFNYENKNDDNYAAASINKKLLDYLTNNDFETYVIAPDEQVLDIKFDSNNPKSNITTQCASLRELAHCSPTRGKYIIGNVKNSIWKEQLMHLTEKNVFIPKDIEISNNTIALSFDKNFKDGEEIDLTLLQEDARISDLFGNEIQEDKINYKLKAEVNNDIKPLEGGLMFTTPETTIKEKSISVQTSSGLSTKDNATIENPYGEGRYDEERTRVIKKNGKFYTDNGDRLINVPNPEKVKEFYPLSRYPSSSYMVRYVDNTVYVSSKSSFYNSYYYTEPKTKEYIDDFLDSKIVNITRFQDYNDSHPNYLLTNDSDKNIQIGYIDTKKIIDTMNIYKTIDQIDTIISYDEDDYFIRFKDGRRYIKAAPPENTFPDDVVQYYCGSDCTMYLTKTGHFKSIAREEEDYHLKGEYSNIKKAFMSDYGYLLLTEDGRIISKFDKDDEDYYKIRRLNGETNVVDFVMYHNCILYASKDWICCTVRYGEIPDVLENYGELDVDNIIQIGSDSNSRPLVLTSNNTLYTTDEEGRIIKDSNVKMLLNLNGGVYLRNDGTLSKYGKGLQFETYDGFINDKNFLSLKIKNTDTYVLITKHGIEYTIGKKYHADIDYHNYETLVNLGEHSKNGVAYKYKIFGYSESSVEEILLNQKMDYSWKTIKDGDYINNYSDYIGVVEVDRNNRAIRYSYEKAVNLK